MESNVIVDTNYIVSLVDDLDTKHENAQTLLPKILRTKNTYITNYIYIELATVLTQQLGKANTTTLLDQIEGYTEVIYIGKEIEPKIRKAFRLVTSKNLSYVDVSTIVMAKQHSMATLITFDKQLARYAKQQGINVNFR